MVNVLWFVFWLLVLWFISFFVAYFCAAVYIILYLIEVCIPGLSGVNELLLQGIQFPHYCAKAMMEGRSPF